MIRIDVVSQSPKQVVLKVQGGLVDAEVDLREIAPASCERDWPRMDSRRVETAQKKFCRGF